jgi:hypothetical protein
MPDRFITIEVDYRGSAKDILVFEISGATRTNFEGEWYVHTSPDASERKHLRKMKHSTKEFLAHLATYLVSHEVRDAVGFMTAETVSEWFHTDDVENAWFRARLQQMGERFFETMTLVKKRSAHPGVVPLPWPVGIETLLANFSERLKHPELL